jgi:hypothetical protein
MKISLATSKFCGPCQVIKAYIQENALDVELKELGADPEFFIKYDIKSVPTLICDDVKTTGADAIMKILQDEKSKR